jgi:SAM-dependent methyltransferase
MGSGAGHLGKAHGEPGPPIDKHQRPVASTLERMTFKDHFSANAASYAQYRPSYPRTLFKFVVGLCTQRRIAWDCATGNGQAALELAPHFERIIATDASAKQIANASPHPGITYHVATAENSGIVDTSVDAITVAQALHWFNLDRFYTEVRRVATPGAVIAVWSYGDPVLDAPGLDTALQQFNGGTVGSYWPAERHTVGAGYTRLPFPFAEVPSPSLWLEQRWTRNAFTGYLRTWSAVGAYRTAHGADPVTEFEQTLSADWNGHETHVVRWPLTIRAGRVE